MSQSPEQQHPWQQDCWLSLLFLDGSTPIHHERMQHISRAQSTTWQYVENFQYKYCMTQVAAFILPCYWNCNQGPISQKSCKIFRPKTPFEKLRPAYSINLVFSYLVKGINIKMTAKFCASRCLHFQDTKRIMSPKMHPKSFGTFKKRAPAGLQVLPMRKEW